MRRLRRTRRRDGAFMWKALRDIEGPSRVAECFMVESWLEHLRQHERVIFVDQEISKLAQAFHLGSEPLKVTHLLTPQTRSRRTTKIARLASAAPIS